ncbi:alpha/beta hydrolase [Ensifer sp. ENS04]|uniref:alpha/beta fold hydrolase n=1 Tax=Ensifer sp. ENS04 TaxID=2769281 RepID=UPI0017863314|nr:alpha/beta hydrolase [Ensifer sp. ENS04]MBD9541392.1 alpha/beta hydrolase [Ensifer sp. ENS04]
MLSGFREVAVHAGGIKISAAVAGDGPPLLLMHGYPQTNAMWHKIAPELAQHFTVVASDLRGYGKSDKPKGGAGHVNYSKRVMARDQVELMRRLGFRKFSVVGHDRGARVAHRMALDHADVLERIALLDIAPTEKMYRLSDKRFATAYYHWYFLIQPFDLPERLIGFAPEYYLKHKLKAWSRVPGAFSEEAVAEYVRHFSDPKAIHASCEDYRAAATIDLEHDAADAHRKISQPLLVLWGQLGVVGKLFDVVEAWRERADDVRGAGLACGHFLAEEVPEETLQLLTDFLIQPAKKGE